MGFATSIIPLESNTGYIHSELFSYTLFSGWFDQVKMAFSNEGNFSELKSDRVEAIHDLYGAFASITFSDRGFENQTRPSVMVRTDNGRATSRTILVLPEPDEGESVDDLTKRWVESLHSQIDQILRTAKIRARWFEFSFSGEEPNGDPPDLFPPTLP